MPLIYRPKHPLSNENGLIERALVDPEATDPHVYVISDTMPETRHMATGKMHTSKAKFREDTKASGCIEYGNDSSLGKQRKQIPLSREKRREDIQRSIYNIRNGIRTE